MEKISKLIKVCLRVIIYFCLITFAILLFIILRAEIRGYLDPMGVDRDICIDDGHVWDGDEKRCRTDCVYWNVTDGCVVY